MPLKLILRLPLLLIALNFPVHASEPLPFNNQLKQLMAKTFFKGQHISSEKLTQYRLLIQRRREDVAGNLLRMYTLKKGKSAKKAHKKTAEKDDILAYDIILNLLNKMEQETDVVRFQQLALQALRLDRALKISARKLASVELIEKIPFSLKGKKIPIHHTPRGEASNLLNPVNGLFYSQSELAELKRRGKDISALNPPSDGTFWTDHDISAIDVKQFYLSGQDPLHKGLDIDIPYEKAYFDKVRKTQSKPKLDLFYHHNGRKLECKLKVAAEVYSETTSAALLTALGFSADITVYVKNFKVVLGKTTFRQFRLEWESYYGNYQLDKYIKTRGSDKEGNFIVFYEGVLELKPPELMRVGSWAYGGNGNGGMREVRALLLFNMWVNNLDLKESENNKLIIRKSGDHFRYFHIQHDLGFSFGKTYMERPGAFLWNVVKKKNDKYVVMNFNCLVDNSLFDYVTFADARWMVRLISRLNRHQIAAAVDLGGWPKPLRGLLVEKLIARRNQLVEAFDLTGTAAPTGKTIKIMPVDRHLTTPDGVVKDGKLTVFRFDGHPQYFGPRFNEIMALILKGIRNGAVDAVVNLAASVRYIVLKPEDFGLDRRIISKIVLRMDRQIERNPDPHDESDTFLVKDTLRLGLRLGYGSVISGDIGYWRKYTLVYPVKSRDEGRFHNKFILNLLLPFRHSGRYAPRNHALMLEDYLEGRGKIRLTTLDDMIECALTTSKIYLHRHFIQFSETREHSRAVYFSDSSLYNELRFRVFFEFLNFFRSTPVNMYTQKGWLTRDRVDLDTSDLENNSMKRRALDSLLLEGDASLIKQVGQKTSLHTTFTERKSQIKLLGILKRRSVFRMDQLTLNSGQNKSRFILLENRKLNQWGFLDNGERHLSSVRLSARTQLNNKIVQPRAVLLFRIDDRSTHDGELKHGYIHFINRVALDNTFLPFDSTLHSVNRLWGVTRTEVRMVLYEAAVRKLLTISPAEIWQALASVTGKTSGYWLRLSRNRYRRGRLVPRYSSDEHYLAVKTRYFIRELRNASRAGKESEKLRLVHKALSKTIYTSGQAYEPTLPAMLHLIAGDSHMYLDASITMPENKELIFPARAPLYNQIGIFQDSDIPLFRFSFDDPSEIFE